MVDEVVDRQTQDRQTNQERHELRRTFGIDPIIISILISLGIVPLLLVYLVITRFKFNVPLLPYYYVYLHLEEKNKKEKEKEREYRWAWKSDTV